MATEPVVRGKPEEVAVAVATVVGFGGVAIVLYPALYHLLQAPHPVSATAYGLWAGSTIHEVAQVVAAGHAVGNAAADTAVIAKIVRVMMLAPFLVGCPRGARARAGRPRTHARRSRSRGSRSASWRWPGCVPPARCPPPRRRWPTTRTSPRWRWPWPRSG
jgi:uncharacterized membrane protein YadS